MQSSMASALRWDSTMAAADDDELSAYDLDLPSWLLLPPEDDDAFRLHLFCSELETRRATFAPTCFRNLTAETENSAASVITALFFLFLFLWISLVVCSSRALHIYCQ
ncbi:unnamed protein product [Cuscuta campestris]|uniref:Uncharacterized protein n=1 Tax=Cuscuta campestris TaxID=132261 RepID=A0A484MMQ8_9ASTE|nr:unnamed protein product [Cuscuta campestris]